MMMKRALIAVVVVGGLCGVGAFANTYVGGVENSLPGSSVEGYGDYNDLIFSLSSSSLTLVTATGQWGAFSSAIVNENQTYPTTNSNSFWDNVSLDDTTGSPKNIGYCLTTNNCGLGGSSGSPVDGVYQFLHGASGQGVADNSFYFSVTSGQVVTIDLAAIASSNTGLESLGWYDIANPLTVGGLIIPQGSAGTAGTYSFTPTVNNFGLFFDINGSYYFTQTSLGGSVNASRFALFQGVTPSSVPEPGTMVLFGLGAVALGLIPRLRKRRNN